VEFDSAIKIKQIAHSEVVSLKDLKTRYLSLKDSKDTHILAEFGDDVLILVRAFRSPSLGIGSEQIKTDLIELEAEAGYMGKIYCMAIYFQ
jgi:hypothetical protein